MASAYVVILAAVVPTCVNVTPSMLRWMIKPVSTPASVSVQERLTTFAETATAVRDVGAVSSGIAVSGLGVVTVATVEKGDGPLADVASTR